MGQISKFLPWRENFALEHDASGLESIPLGTFTHFGRPMAENYESVFLTIVQVNGGLTLVQPKSMVGRFDRRARATIIPSPYFRPMVRLGGGGVKIYLKL